MKSHHYIISFDPRDGADNGLTVDRAQELGEKFCKEHFPGHQALSAPTRTDTTTAAISMCISSSTVCGLRKSRCCPTWTDQRHRKPAASTAAPTQLWNISRAEVMEMCHREGLYQIDLLNGSKERITEREYWAQRKDSLPLKRERPILKPRTAAPKPTKFETDKAKLRRTIRQALSQAASFDEFLPCCCGRV